MTEFGHYKYGYTYGQSKKDFHGGKKDRAGVGARITDVNPAHVETGDGSVKSKVRRVGADLEGRAAEMKGQRGYSGASEGGLNAPGAEETFPVPPEQTASDLH